jgi:hypothetical protein
MLKLNQAKLKRLAFFSHELHSLSLSKHWFTQKRFRPPPDIFLRA